MTASVVVQQYFDKRRAFAAGVSSMGKSIASLTIGPFYTFLIQQYGWRGALIIHAGIVLQGVVLGAMFKPLDTEHGRAASPSGNAESTNDMTTMDTTDKPSCFILKFLDITLLRQETYVLFVVSMVLLGFSVSIVYFLTPSRAVFAGMSKMQGTLLLSCLGLFSTASRFVSSFVANMSCTNRVVQVSIMMFMGGIVASLYNFCRTFLSSVVAAALYGITMGEMLSDPLC